MNAPDVSVVVATCNRRASLGRLLDALAAQTGLSRFEVVVVDDASVDDTPDLLATAGPFDAFVLRTIRLPANRGPAVARNAGWRAANAPLICFTDDDCQPTPTWLAALAGALRTTPVVQGRTVPDPGQVARWGPWSHTVEVLREGGFYETCNMGYRREALTSLGGFDESFRRPYGEDADLGWRAREAGLATAFVAEALVYHDVSASSWPAWVRDLRRRDALVRVVRAHPQLRDELPSRWYTRSTHPAVLAAAATLVLAATRPRRLGPWFLAAAASGHYFHTVATTRRGPRRRAHWPVVLPLAFVADLAEVGVLARASWRLRTFLL